MQLLPESVDIESPLPSYYEVPDVLGLITLEDCLEELLQEEILDEQDLNREVEEEHESETQALCVRFCVFLCSLFTVGLPRRQRAPCILLRCCCAGLIVYVLVSCRCGGPSAGWRLWTDAVDCFLACRPVWFVAGCGTGVTLTSATDNTSGSATLYWIMRGMNTALCRYERHYCDCLVSQVFFVVGRKTSLLRRLSKLSPPIRNTRTSTPPCLRALHMLVPRIPPRHVAMYSSRQGAHRPGGVAGGYRGKDA